MIFQVVHNYGHGGNGISLSWGTSVAATSLFSSFLHAINTKRSTTSRRNYEYFERLFFMNFKHKCIESILFRVSFFSSITCILVRKKSGMINGKKRKGKTKKMKILVKHNQKKR